MRLLLLVIVGVAAKPNGGGQYSSAAPSKQSEFIKLVMDGPPNKCVGDHCDSAKYRCEVRQCRCEVCIPKTCADIKCKPNEKCVHTPGYGPICKPKTCADIKCEPNEKCVDTPGYGPICKPKTCKDIQCKPNELCDDTPQGAKCRPKTCDDIDCGPQVCELNIYGIPECRPKTCKELYCKPNEVCDDTPNGGKCRPKTCKDITCGPYEVCHDGNTGPYCKPRTCADIRCAAGEKCDDGLPDGPDCVMDVPTCEGYFCRRGTNCYIRFGSPICLPNTCEVRECEPGLRCIDTKDGALCRKGELKGTCTGKYCPPNTQCEMKDAVGPTCAHI